MTHGDFNDVKRHVAGKGHQKHYKEVTQKSHDGVLCCAACVGLVHENYSV